jgi:esterase
MRVLNSIIIGGGDKHIIILHGMLGMGGNWKFIASRLSEVGFCIHLVDQRNHGKSFWDDEFSYNTLCGDLNVYYDFHNITEAILLGHSMGGKVAMKFALEYSKKVSKLIIIDIAPKKYKPNQDEILEALDSIDLKKIKSKIHVDEHLKRFIPDREIRQFLLKNLYWKTPEELGLRLNIKGINKGKSNLYCEIISEKVFLKETIFIKGDLSIYIEKEDSIMIEKLFPFAKIKIIPNAGHWTHAENPKYFLKVLLEFLN